MNHTIDIATLARPSAAGATVHHASGRRSVGRAQARYHRVERPVIPAQPNYAARRVAAAFGVLVAGMVMLQAAAGLGALFGASPALAEAPASVSHAAPEMSAPGATHVARDGDSLWSIADRYRGDVGRDAYVDALVDLNGGTVVYIGQAVRLP